MAKQKGGGTPHRVFSAEFKLEVVRRVEERRAAGVRLATIARELGIGPDLLRVWAKQVAVREGASPGDVFPGSGHVPTEQAELRRLQHENARLTEELEFLKKAAAYFARTSR